jgi:alkylated DNA repair protein alkB family protein 8
MSFKSWKNEQRHIYLPERSLVVFAGEGRYAWQHSIAQRKLDKVEDQLVFRRRRISLTFRRIKKTPCKCAFPFYCDSQGYDPVTMKKSQHKLAKDDEKARYVPASEEEQKMFDSFSQQELVTPSELEKKYVYEVYEKIAPHFSHTRYKAWPKIETHLNQLPLGSIVADVGKAF